MTFTGSVNKAQLTVDKILSDTGGLGVVNGSIISGPAAAPSVSTQVIHDHNPPGSKGGPGEYSMFHSTHTTASGTYTETYGKMTVTQVISGTVQVGVQVSGHGITGYSPQTGVDKLLNVGAKPDHVDRRQRAQHQDADRGDVPAAAARRVPQ